MSTADANTIPAASASRTSSLVVEMAGSHAARRAPSARRLGRPIVLRVGFLPSMLRLGAILAGGLLVLLGRAAVSLGEIAGQFFRGRRVFLGKRLVHQG